MEEISKLRELIVDKLVSAPVRTHARVRCFLLWP